MNNHTSFEEEKSLLNLSMHDIKNIEKIRSFLSIDHFNNEKNKVIYQILLDFLDEGFSYDPNLVIKEAKLNFKTTILESYLEDIYYMDIEPSNLGMYAKTLIDVNNIRNVDLTINKVADVLKKDPSPKLDTIKELIEKGIYDATGSERVKKFDTANELSVKALEEITFKRENDVPPGIYTQFPKLNELTMGLQKGDLIILAARPSVGKTAFAINIASKVSESYKVALFSLEMPSIQIMNRMLAAKSQVPLGKIKNSKNLSDTNMKWINNAAQLLGKQNLFVDDTSGIKISEIGWKLKQLKKNNGLDLVVIDYLQLITVENSRSSDNRQVEVSKISRLLKQYARELNVPVIALSQLSRKVEMRENKKPMLSDLRESGAIEQDADIIAFLYRESYQDEEKDKEDIVDVELLIKKHRNGETGKINLNLNKPLGLFTSSKGEK